MITLESPAPQLVATVPGRRKRKVADLFCGAGGTTTGFVRAHKKHGIECELVVVNHWTVAIKTHRANHPEALHICTPLEDVSPSEVIKGHLDHLHASPECTHHSRAAGGRPRNDQSRSSADYVLQWAKEKGPTWVTIENVVEFMDWGPLDDYGRPDKALKGTLFKKWIEGFEKLGYRCEWRTLNAADYGDPTSRKRFIMIARLGGGEIPWPTRSHVSRREKKKGIDANLPTWRSAREIIDWSDTGESIFTRKKPLAEKTIQRIIKGLEKYGGEAAEPFLLVLRNNIDCKSIDEPIPTVTAGGNHYGVIDTQFVRLRDDTSPEGSTDPFLLRYHKGSAVPDSEPVPTITGTECYAIVDPCLVRYNGTGDVEDIDSPVPTLTTKDRFGKAEFLIHYHAGEGREGRASSVDDPTHTLDCSNRYGLVQAVKLLLPHQKFEIDGCDDPEEPHRTIDATNARCNRVAQAFLVDMNHGVDKNMDPESSANRRSQDLGEPIGTITTQAGKAVVQPFMVSIDNHSASDSSKAHDIEQPLGTIVTKDNKAVIQPFLVPQFGERKGQEPRTASLFDPAPAVTSHGAGALVCPIIIETSKGIFGIDIRLRMLKKTELAAATGFDEDYQFFGTGTDITRQIGNAVPVGLAEAVADAILVLEQKEFEEGDRLAA